MALVITSWRKEGRGRGRSVTISDLGDGEKAGGREREEVGGG